MLLAAEETQALVQDFAGRMVVSPRAVEPARWTTSISPSSPSETSASTASNTSTQFFKDKAKDTAYLTELKKRCDDHGVTSGLIMCDDEGDLGDPDDAKRTEAVENHYKWVEAAKFLGCHSIRVNARSTGDPTTSRWSWPPTASAGSANSAPSTTST